MKRDPSPAAGGLRAPAGKPLVNGDVEWKRPEPRADRAWIPAAIAGTAAAAGGLYYTVGKLFVDSAMDRNQPELLSKMNGFITGFSKSDFENSNAAAERVKALPMEQVEISAPDGTRLAGHWYGCPEPRRVIVAMHGWRSSWARDFASILPFWHEQGCAVLLAEQRAHGDSGGEVIGYGVLERHDCLAWAEYAAHRTGGALPVWLAGISMGATTVMLAAGLDGIPAPVRGVIADCGFTSIGAMWDLVARKRCRLPPELLRPVTDRLCRKKLGFGPREVTTTDALRRTALPVLLIHGLGDDFVPPQMSEENYAACGGRAKRLLRIPHAAHTMSHAVEPERYEAAVMDFWRQFE